MATVAGFLTYPKPVGGDLKQPVGRDKVRSFTSTEIFISVGVVVPAFIVVIALANSVPVGLAIAALFFMAALVWLWLLGLRFVGSPVFSFVLCAAVAAATVSSLLPPNWGAVASTATPFISAYVMAWCGSRVTLDDGDLPTVGLGTFLAVVALLSYLATVGLVTTQQDAGGWFDCLVMGLLLTFIGFGATFVIEIATETVRRARSAEGA